MSGLSIPEVGDDTDMLTAELAYIDAGFYVAPVRRGTKDPGSILGKGWQHKSSRDPQVIAAWFAGADHDIALHCGRSGAVVFDVDYPDKLPDVLARHLDSAPYQSTRPDTPGRGHYIFAMPPGRTLGNGTGRLGGAWGEIRGTNGVIIAEPSRRRRIQVGAPMSIPVLHAELADMLEDASPASDAASDAVVKAFIAEHQTASRPEILNGWKSTLAKKIEAGQSRHNSGVSVLTGAMKEARAGYFAAQAAIDALKPIFINAVLLDHSRTEQQAEHEWPGILAWAVAQANAADLDGIRARAAEKMPDNVEWVRNLADPAASPNGSHPRPTGDTAANDGEGRTKVVADTRRTITLVTATDVADDVPEWAWEYNGKGRIQRGTLSVNAGRPGVGKSTATRWQAAGFSRGTMEGCWYGQPQRVAYIAPAEESVRYTVKPGLRAAGADLNLVDFPHVESDCRKVPLLSLVDEAALTEQLIAAGITVVFVDPMMSTIGSKVDIHRNNEVRAYIEPWARIADAINGIVIGVAHLTKAASGDIVAGININGSSAFGEVPRAVFGFAKDPESDEGHRIMSQAKNSTGEEDLALIYAIQSQTVTTDSGKTADVGKFVILGNSDRTASDVLREANQGSPLKDDACDWLKDYLKHGPKPSRDAKRDAYTTEGYSESMIKRAARKLKVVVKDEGYPRTTYWSLPAVGSQSGQDKQSDPTDPTDPTDGAHSRARGQLLEVSTAQSQLGQSGQLGQSPSVGPTGGPTGIPAPKSAKADRDAANEAYSKGLCKSCHKQPYRPGGTQCEDCFQSRNGFRS